MTGVCTRVSAMDMGEMGDRLRQARIAAGFERAAQAARRLGVPASTYVAHENGQNDFGIEAATAYGRAFSVRPAWLLSGELPQTPSREPEYPHGLSRVPVDANGEPLHHSRSGLRDWPPDSLIRVDEADVRAGGGGGGVVAQELVRTENGITIGDDLIVDSWGVPHSFLVGHLRIKAGAAAIFEVYGDSMYDPSNPAAPGSLYPGDKVIVDTGDVRPSPPGPFAIYDGVGVVIKLVEISRSGSTRRLRLKSRNPSYGDYDATEDEARIIGRVRARISGM